ncbi:MAG: acyl carrier protein [Candidatus Omnitrophica bacterium]|nr:acyl carrier protein [Candidatus Omnitrophota bacterium]MCM8827024.1 acyl carrier protein [Candidatus Omnitrophota bacterium]
MSIKDEVFSLLGETLDVGIEELKEDKSLYDSLGVDSTEMVEVRIALKKKLGVELKDGEITNKQTLREIISIVESKKRL